MGDDWKTFYICHKWMPTSILKKKFSIKDYDINNLKRKPEIKSLLSSWKISLKNSPSNLRKIFEAAWEYYIKEEARVDFTKPKQDWVPKLLSLKNLTQTGGGYSFLTGTKYLQIICPQKTADYRDHGFTNIALAAHEFWPGEAFLKTNGILPHMFLQTHKKALSRVNPQDMVEHVYLNFWEVHENEDKSKEVFCGRYKETGFITSDDLEKYGIPYNFYKDSGGLKVILERIAEKFRLELKIIPEEDTTWSANRFRKMHPDMHLQKCKYCGTRPVDLHHLLSRNDHPSLIYHKENVVPLCVQVHGLITRRVWEKVHAQDYEKAVSEWLRSKNGSKTQAFDNVMMMLHEYTFGL